MTSDKAIEILGYMGVEGNNPDEFDACNMGILAIQESKWTPLKYRPLTEEERERFSDEIDSVFDCDLPDEGEEVLITFKDGSVGTDTFCKDGDYCYFDNYDSSSIIAWRHKPEGYKEEVSE